MRKSIFASTPGKAERPHAIVVGAGLAGIAATFELLERGCHITIIDKAARFPPGNSAKASIGLCAPGIDMEGMKLDAKDSMDDVMVENSDSFMKNAVEDVQWLMSRFFTIEKDSKHGDCAAGLEDFCSVVSPGSKGNNCVIGAKKQLIGTVISGQAMYCLAKLAQTPLIEMISQSEVTKLIKENGQVTGVEYIDASGVTQQLKGTVVIATGGYGGDNSDGSLLTKYKASFAKENSLTDERTNGSGIKIAMDVGAAVERLDEVNLYPLATSGEGMEDDRFRYVLSTLLLGAGGVLLDSEGKRFCDEKGTDPAEICNLMRSPQAKPPFRVVITSEGLPENVEYLCQLYLRHKVLQVYSPGQLARDMGIDASKLEAVVGTRQIYAKTVSPAIYTTTGGLKINKATGAVTTSWGNDIGGLYAAGEAAAGPSQKMYAKTGVPLLHCISSGKAAGLGAATYLNGGEQPAKKDVTALLQWFKLEAEAPAPASRQVTEKASEADLMAKDKDELIAMFLKMQEAGPPAASAAPPAPTVPTGPPTFTEAEVAEHNKKEDAWLIVNGEVVDITAFIPVHPGGVQAICQYLGKDASEEWNTIHKPGMVESRGVKAGCKILGKVGSGAGATNGAAAPKDDGIPWSEIEKHKTKEDIWIVINGDVIDATGFIDKHPGGVPILLANAGKDASEEWNTIHKPGTVEKQGIKLGAKILGKAAGGGVAPPPPQDTGYVEPDSPDGFGALAELPEKIAQRIEGDKTDPRKMEKAEKFRNGTGKLIKKFAESPLAALIYMVLGLLTQVVKTVLWTGNLQFNNERLGTIRSGLFLVLFTVLHSSDNQFTQLGKRQYNGMSYFLADTMQKVKGYQLFDMYIGLCVLLHISVGLKRSWDLNMGYLISSGKWNYMLTGLCILGFLTHHLTSFRFAELFHEDGYVPVVKAYAPPYGVVLRKEIPFAFFWQEAKAPEDCLVSLLCGPGKPVELRDLFTVCYRDFQDPQNVLIYVGFCMALVAHLFLVWPKIVSAGSFQIPRDHQPLVVVIGKIAAVACGLLYVSVPIRFYLGVIPPP